MISKVSLLTIFPHKKLITVLLTLSLMPCITYLWLSYFIKGGLCLLIPVILFCPTFSASSFLPTAFTLCIWIFSFCFSASTCKWDHTVFVFFVQLISLPIKPSRSINIIAKHKIAFFVAKECSVVYIYHALFFHSSIKRYLDRFYILAIANNAAVNMQIGV